jgi:hypothetical protein
VCQFRYDNHRALPFRALVSRFYHMQFDPLCVGGRVGVCVCVCVWVGVCVYVCVCVCVLQLPNEIHVWGFDASLLVSVCTKFWQEDGVTVLASHSCFSLHLLTLGLFIKRSGVSSISVLQWGAWLGWYLCTMLLLPCSWTRAAQFSVVYGVAEYYGSAHWPYLRARLSWLVLV